MSLKKVVECVKKHKRFLITSHTGLEGDALGSELAFSRLLEKMGKSVVIVNDDQLPAGYDFLPGVGKIKRYSNSLQHVPFDCFVALDCSDSSRYGKVARINAAAKKPAINIDHHVSNSYFADANWVEPRASSTAEMVYWLFKKMHLAIDRDTALSLYVGIFTDTGSFRYPNTTAATHRAAADLLSFKLDIAQVYKKTYEDMPFAYIHIVSNILSTIKRDASGKIAWLYVKRGWYNDEKAQFDLTDYLLGILRAIKGVEAAVLFRESNAHKGVVRVNLRSQGKVDVNKVALAFGGGGHKTASGCSVRGSLAKAAEQVIKKIKERLK